MDLIEAKFEIYHENCWTTELPEIFGNDYIIYPYSREITQKYTRTFILVKEENLELERSLYLEKYSKFKPKVIGPFANDIKIISFNFFSKNSVVRSILRIENFFPYTMFYESENEMLDFIVPERKSKYYADIIKSHLESVSQIKSINFSIPSHILRENVKRNLELILTKDVLDILEQLMEIGYFDFPRRISIEDAAKKIGISKGYISKVSRKIFNGIKN